MKEQLFDFIYKSYNKTWIKAIRRGLLKIQPLIFISCFFIVLIELPFSGYKTFMNQIFGKGWYQSLITFYTIIYNVTKFSLIMTISYSLTNIRNKKQCSNINPIIVSIMSFLATIILADGIQIEGTTHLSAQISFISILFCILTSEIFIFIYRAIEKKFEFKELTYYIVVSQSIKSSIPMLLTIIIAILMKPIFVLGVNLLNNFQLSIKYHIDTIFNVPILNELEYVITTQIVWFLGGHGGDIIDKTLMLNKPYIDSFINLGGAGATLCCIIAIFLVKTNKYTKSVAKLGGIASVFNVNEILTYGIPIIFNPIYVIPFVITPVVLLITTAIAVYSGFLPMTDNTISWTTPVFFSGYLLSGSINGSILQGINLFIGVLIYIPFIKVHKRVVQQEDLNSYKVLLEKVYEGDLNNGNLLIRDDGIGQVCRKIAVDLNESIKNNNGLYMEYQPLVNKSGKVVSVESLLRYKHKDFGNIPPNLVVMIAENANIINDLGKWIIKKSCSEFKVWEIKNIDLGINISTLQLKDESFSLDLKNILREFGINPENIKLEITESLAIGDDENTKRQLMELEKVGIKLAIDDFGVGYNPILYIKKYKIHSMKIDGSLIRDIETNKESREIVKSMYNLCENSGIEIVSEFVESKEQKVILDSMGDGIYQGYLFSRPLKSDECYSYISDNLGI